MEHLCGGIMVIALSQSCPGSCSEAVCAGRRGIPTSLGVCRDHLDEHPSGTCSWDRAGTGESMSRASALLAEAWITWSDSCYHHVVWVLQQEKPVVWVLQQENFRRGMWRGRWHLLHKGRDCALVQLLPRPAPAHPFRAACSSCATTALPGLQARTNSWRFLLSPRLAGWCGIGWWLHLLQELQWSCMMDLL